MNMAIQIEWLALPAATDDKDRETKLYPRIKDNGEVDFKLLCEKIAKRHPHTKGAIISIVSDMVETMSELLCEGRAVKIDDLGTFRLTIKANGTVTPDTPPQKRTATVRGVSFQPHKNLIDAIGRPAFRATACNANAAIMDTEQVKQELTKYFETHDSITRAQLETLCKFSRVTAHERLKQLVNSGFLRQVGYNKMTKYEKTEACEHDT